MARYVGKSVSGSGTFISGSHSHGNVMYGGSGNYVHALLSNTGSQVRFLSQVSGDIPSWSVLDKSLVGLENVENIAIGTWTGNPYLSLSFTQVTGVASKAQGGLGASVASGIAINTVLAGPASGSSGEASFRQLVQADIPSLGASKITTGTLSEAVLPVASASNPGIVRIGSGLSMSGNALSLSNAGVGLGSVTYVGLEAPNIFSVSGSPISGSGVFAISLASQTSNMVFAAPSSGSSGLPSFRSLTNSDIPSISASKIASGTISTSVLPLASTSGIGVVSVGSGLSISAQGVLSAIDPALPDYVSYVGLSLPAIFSVSTGSVTTSGTLTATLHSQVPSLVFASPSSSTGTPSFRALVASDIPTLDASKITTGTFSAARLPVATSGAIGAIKVGTGLSIDTGGTLSITNAEVGLGTVTSVGLTGSGVFAITNSPVTNSGTLSLGLASQALNTVLAGPSSGSSAEPSFRSLVEADIPNINANKITTGTLLSSVLPLASNSEFGAVKAGVGISIVSGVVTVSGEGLGTVTSVDIAVPAFLSTSGGPITSAGTITLSATAQSATHVLIGPASGSASASPSFRALTASDIPNLSATQIASGTLSASVMPTATASLLGAIKVGSGLAINAGILSTNIDIYATAGPQNNNTVFAGPSAGSDANPTFRALVAADIPDLNASKITAGTIDAARLPTATASALGGIKVGSGLSISNGVLRADVDLSSSAGNVTANTFLAGPTSGVAALSSFRAITASDVPSLSTDKLTSGVLPVVRGGTGLSGVGSASQILGVSISGGNIEYKTLSAGPRITISHSAGAISIGALDALAVTGGVLAGHLDFNYAYQAQNVKGIRSYIAATSTGGLDALSYAPVATVSITDRYGYVGLTLLVGSDGGSGDASALHSAVVSVRVKQQNVMASSTYVQVEVLNATGPWDSDSFIFIQTSNTASLTEGTLYVRSLVNYSKIVATVLQYATSTTNASYVLCTSSTTVTNTYVPTASLPSGTQTKPQVFSIAAPSNYTIRTSGTERIRVTDSGLVGINTSSPSYALSFGGASGQTIGLERNTTANTSGSSLTLRAGGATTSATDKDGGDLILQAGPSTGMGHSEIRLQTYTRSLTTSTSDNTALDRLYISSFKNLTNSTATKVFSFSLPASSMNGGSVSYAIEVSNGTAYQTIAGILHYTASRASTGEPTISLLDSSTSGACTSGTLALNWTTTRVVDDIEVKATATSSLTPASGYPRIQFTITHNGSRSVTV